MDMVYGVQKVGVKIELQDTYSDWVIYKNKYRRLIANKHYNRKVEEKARPVQL
jgi:hypothetical protein